jgi:adenylosuccinate synthase
VLCEGAQGTLLDVGYGTYPFVTSSHTIAGGACTGLGIGPNAIGNVVGVLKAYCTRVGAGPFPSELLDERGERMRRQGSEFGTVTGRPRRCGWLDAAAARYAVALNGLTSAVITKLDVLSGFESLGIVTGYRLGTKPASFSDVADPRLDVEIEELPGWNEPIDGVRTIAGLPPNARRYVERIGELLGVPIECVSVGRERTQLAR